MINQKQKGVIGIDEVGRGPLAGPITVCAVYLRDWKRVKRDVFNNSVRDSKKISKVLRLKIFKTITKNRKINNDIIYTLHSKSAAYIDRYGIQVATQKCIDACVMGLARQGVDIYGVLIRTDAGIHVHDTNVLQKAYIKGDERFTEIALASILAKETRDAYMHNLHTNNPEYGWNTNAGYGTEKHRTALQVHGTTKYHRHSFLQSFKQLQNKEEK